MAIPRRSLIARTAAALASIALLFPVGADALSLSEEESVTLDSFATPEPKLALALPAVADCSSKALVERSTLNCYPRRLTSDEKTRQVVRDQGLKGLTLVEDPKLFLSPSFTMASYNVLGTSHTDGPGANRPDFPSSRSRMGESVQVLRNSGVSLAGLQEFQAPQYSELKRLLPTWDVYPGLETESYAVQNSIVWDTAVWSRVEVHTIDIPYFNGKAFKMPYVKLRHVESGQTVWVGNFHNPANVAGPAASLRAEATRREAELAASLNQNQTPTFITGDMNDREKFFCPFTDVAPAMKGSNGARRSESGTCQLGSPISIDWILGSPEALFSDHVVDRSTEAKQMSDHPMIRARVTLQPSLDRAQCVSVTVRKAQLTFCPTAAVQALS